MAANGVQGLTCGTPDGARLLLDHMAHLGPALLKLCTDQSDISKAALTSLVNLSQARSSQLPAAACPCRYSLPHARAPPCTSTACVMHGALQEAAAAERLRQARAIGRSMDYLRERATQHEALLVMLLTNLTASEQGCSQLLQLDRPELQGLHV